MHHLRVRPVGEVVLLALAAVGLSRQRGKQQQQQEGAQTISMSSSSRWQVPAQHSPDPRLCARWTGAKSMVAATMHQHSALLHCLSELHVVL